MVLPRFSSYAQINATLLALACEPPEASHEIWITDISWTDSAVDAHLQRLVDRGVCLYWIDHHRTALERYASGAVSVRFTHHVLSEARAASWLTFDYVCERARQAGAVPTHLESLRHLVTLADDNDRWLHGVAGSRQLAITVGAMHDTEAYQELLSIDPCVTYSAVMLAAQARAQAEIQRSFAVAERSRVERIVGNGRLRLVTAVCDGYPSEIAGAWGPLTSNTVFALFDTRSLSVSLRRSPDCCIDLSQVAKYLGGGGHPAAAGCELSEPLQAIANAVGSAVLEVLTVTTEA
jgi:oligoribonuclease NrnB/cAMP/cGMP phosphodiesterase (DHH superfamily)